MSAKMLEKPVLLLLGDEEILGSSRPINGFLSEKLGEPLTAGIPWACKMLQLGAVEESPAIRQVRATEPSIMQTRGGSNGKSRFFQAMAANGT